VGRKKYWSHISTTKHVEKRNQKRITAGSRRREQLRDWSREGGHETEPLFPTKKRSGEKPGKIEAAILIRKRWRK